MKIGIVGLGLIGGSLAKALKARGRFTIVAADTCRLSLQKAKADGVIDGFSHQADALFADCALIFICTPVQTIVPVLEALLPFVPPDCIITDVGSTKLAAQESVLAMQTENNGFCYIGGHPMAGSEKTGYAAAKEYLFENAYYVLTPAPDAPAEKVTVLADIVRKIGAIPICVPAGRHDFLVAAVSHMPHIVASALTNTAELLETEEELLKTLAAGGFKDITRIASANPAMWAGICLANRADILRCLDAFGEQLQTVRHTVEAGDRAALLRFFASAKDFRDSLSEARPKSYAGNYEILLDVLDKPGSIANVALVLSQNGINIKNIGILNSREYRDGIMQILLENEDDREKAVSLLKEIGAYIP